MSNFTRGVESLQLVLQEDVAGKGEVYSSTPIGTFKDQIIKKLTDKPVKSILYVMSFKAKHQGVFIFSPVFKQWMFRPKNLAYMSVPIDFVRKAFKTFKVASKKVHTEDQRLRSSLKIKG